MSGHDTTPPAGRRWAVLLWALLMAAALGQILRTSFTTDLSAFLPDNPDAQQRVLIEQLQAGVPARTLLLAIEGGEPRARADASARWRWPCAPAACSSKCRTARPQPMATSAAGWSSTATSSAPP
jgi:predicted exporter